MRRDKEVTRVIFKKAYDHTTRAWFVVAFFPGLEANVGRVQDYMHLGQHGESDYEWYLSCKPASPEEYAPLKKELEQAFGYRFKVVKRMSRSDCDKAWDWARRHA